MKKTSRILAFLLAFVMVFATCSISPANAAGTASVDNFTDVSKAAWFRSAVDYCVKAGYMSGTSATKFSPTVELNRGMMVTILWNMAGRPSAKKTTKFTDINGTTAYYYKAVQWAAETKVVSGFADGSFGAAKSITREQLASMMRNYAKYSGLNVSSTTDLSSFSDAAKVSSYALAPVQWAVACKVISGKSGGKLIDPKGSATRAEAAAMIMNYCKNVVEWEATDNRDWSNLIKIAPWDEVVIPGFQEKQMLGWSQGRWMMSNKENVSFNEKKVDLGKVMKPGTVFTMYYSLLESGTMLDYIWFVIQVPNRGYSWNRVCDVENAIGKFKVTLETADASPYLAVRNKSHNMAQITYDQIMRCLKEAYPKLDVNSIDWEHDVWGIQCEAAEEWNLEKVTYALNQY